MFNILYHPFRQRIPKNSSESVINQYLNYNSFDQYMYVSGDSSIYGLSVVETFSSAGKNRLKIIVQIFNARQLNKFIQFFLLFQLLLLVVSAVSHVAEKQSVALVYLSSR